MVTQYIEKKLTEKSRNHRAKLKRLGTDTEYAPLSPNVLLLAQTPQLKGVNTIVQDMNTPTEDFIFYFDRMAALLVEQ